MGAHNNFSPQGRSSYELANLTGCFSYMTVEQPVSYTHLDVYKRQDEDLSAGTPGCTMDGARGFLQSQVPKCEGPGARAILLLVHGLRNRGQEMQYIIGFIIALFIAVSYTHLDVYKRQGQRRLR